MKYIKTYENAEKNSVKLANAFVNFLSSLKPLIKFRYYHYVSASDCNCVYVYSNQVINIYGNNPSRIILYTKDYFTKEETKNISDFLFNINCFIESKNMYIKDDRIPEFIEKLTKENYDNFLIQQDADKYNL